MSPTVNDHAPTVTVAISTHSRSDYLKLAAASVLSQTFTDFELLICDDASEDETPKVCEELRQLDSRVRIVRHDQNVGMVENWNSALKEARGRYFAKLDDDNRYTPNFLERLVSLFESDVVVTFAFCDEWMIDQYGMRLPRASDACSARYGRDNLKSGLQPDTAVLAVRQSVPVNGCLMRREAVIDAGGFRSYAQAAADIDLFLNLASRGGVAAYVPERFIEYRIHECMSTAASAANVAKNAAAALMWDRFRFTGLAERIRKRQLASARFYWGRAVLLEDDVVRCRKMAWRYAPTSGWVIRRWIMAYLCCLLPRPLRKRLLKQRYHETVSAQSASVDSCT